MFQITTSAKKRKYKWKDDQADDFETSLLRKASLALDCREDVYDSHGKTIAAKLRRVASANYDQFLLADSLLNQVLFKALKNQLTVNTTITDLTNVPLQGVSFQGWAREYNATESISGSSPTSTYSVQSPPSPVPSTAQDVESNIPEIEESHT